MKQPGKLVGESKEGYNFKPSLHLRDTALKYMKVSEVSEAFDFHRFSFFEFKRNMENFIYDKMLDSIEKI